MKKWLSILLVLLLITGCKKVEEPKVETNKVIELEEEHIEESYIDDNPIKIAFYEGNGGTYKKITSFKSKVEKLKDIGVFAMLLSEEEVVYGSNRKSLYYELSEKYPNFSHYKIGYSIKFTTQEEEIYEMFLTPRVYSTYPLADYLYVWFYDDINTTGWHSHLEEDEYNDNTIMSSVKLMWAVNANQIISDIELTVFTYDEDDFDELGHYRGISKNTILIEKE